MNEKRIQDLKWLRANWERVVKPYLAPRLPPLYFGLLEWLATTELDEIVSELEAAR